MRLLDRMIAPTSHRPVRPARTTAVSWDCSCPPDSCFAAGQDWYEQGDIWEQIAAHRGSEHRPGGPSPTTMAAMRRLITAAADTDDSPLRSAPDWPMAFQHAVRALAELAQRGTLTRGLRAVLAHHALFTFNRLGLAAKHQHLLATAASQVVFQC